MTRRMILATILPRPVQTFESLSDTFVPAEVFDGNLFFLGGIMHPQRALVCWLAAALLAPGVFAQEITGSIRGSVVDPAGAAIPGAKVVVINADTKLAERSVESNASGEYTAPLLPVGNYTVQVDAPGFKQEEQVGIALNVGDRLVENFSLQVGSATQTVEVAADALQVQLENASAEGLITGEQVRGLPLNNRNYEQLLALQPGISGNVPDQLYVGVYNYQNQTNVASFSVGGGRDTQNNWTIDGADNVDRGSNRTLLNYPSVDAISEFKVLRSSYNAEYGRGAAGQVTVITRSGAQQFHGGVYEFFRNDALDANTFFNNQSGLPRQPLRYNDFGGTIGGPLFIPGIYDKNRTKTFFFFSEEMRRIKTPVQFNAEVPNANLRNNSFPQPVCTSFDADENCLATARSVKVTPQASAYLTDIFSHIPLPQAVSDPFLLTASAAAKFNYQEEFYRIDHQFNQKIAVMGRFLNDKIPTTEPGGLFTGSNLPGVSTTATNTPGKSWVARVTATLSPALYNETGYAYSYGALVSNPTGLDSSLVSRDILPTLTLPVNSTLTRVPDLVFDNFEGVTGFGQYRDFNRNHNIFDNLTYLAGNHSMKFGITYNHYNKNENSAGNTAQPANGSFYFGEDGQPDIDPSVDDGFESNYQEWANFLQGHVQTFTQQSKDLTADIIENSYEVYGQDEWRVRPNFTLSYGLRYSLWLAPTDGGNELTNFDPARFNVASARPLDSTGHYVGTSGDQLDGVIIGTKNSPYGGGVNETAKTAFAPRVGFSLDPFGDGKTSVRGGYGIFQEPVLAGLWETAVYQNLPFNSSTAINETSFANPGGAAALVSTTPPGLQGFGIHYHSSYSQQFSFDIQREVHHGMVIDAGYYGQTGTHLVGQRDINSLRPGQAVAAGLQTAGKPIKAGASTLALNPIRPYPGWGSISIFDPVYSSNYNSLQTQIQKRFDRGSLVGANYTWSKALTNNQTAYGTQSQNAYNFNGDYGPMQIDRRNVFNANYVYLLPFFREQSNLVSERLGGFQFSGIFTANSGLPLTVFQSSSLGDAAGLGLLDPSGLGSTPRPNLLFSPQKGALHKQARWFNPAAFALNTTTGQPGSEPRGAVRGPGYWRYDMALEKNFMILERLKSQLRVEGFNLFNHTNFSSIRTSGMPTHFNPADPTTFGSWGHVTATRDPRIVQVALRIDF